MAVTPNTILRLLKVPIEIDNKNQITFANEQAQRQYFLSLPHIEIDEISYQRKDNIIYFPDHIDNIINYNYVMYKNENYTNKWFYAFITNMEYENDYNTKISITTDVFQTWQFNLTFKESFIEREMLSVADDVPGANLIPEGLELGEIKINNVANLDCLIPVAIVAYSRNPYTDGLTQEQPTAQGIIANGIPNGVFYCICSFDMLQGLLASINGAGFGESIITVFTVPALAVVGFNNWTIQDIISGGLLSWLVTDFKATPIEKTLVTLPSELDGYTPRNQKLRTYPYLYLGFSPQNGSQKIYRYEDFTNGVPVFKICSELNQNPTVCFIPKNYRGSTNENLQDISILKGYPTIGWITEYFNSWLAQNSDIISIQMRQEEYNYEHNQVISQGQNIANTLSTLLSGAMNGNIGAGLVGSDFAFNQEKLKMNTQNHYEYINMMMAQKEKQSLLPNPRKFKRFKCYLVGLRLY